MALAKLTLRKAPRRCSEEDAAGRTRSQFRWADIPQDLGILVCQHIGSVDVCKLLAASRKARDLTVRDEVWRFFCEAQWGKAANLHIYASAKELFHDRNGWFPRRKGNHKSCLPCFQVSRLTLHEQPCLTMDLRMTNQEIIAVSDAPRSRNGHKKATVHVMDTSSQKIKGFFEVSESTINCCDVATGLICIGSNDCKVRMYRQSSSLEAARLAGGYKPAEEIVCSSTVNDLRVTREDAIVVVRTHQNRHPVGLDLIPLGRPDARMSFPGGSWATRGKYIHALDGFEEGCSTSCIACSGEHPLTSAFSVMLFDFRLSSPCVSDVPVTSREQGHALGTMLWPLRAGQSHRVFANLLYEEAPKTSGGIITMVDFRYPVLDPGICFELPDPVDDFRCFSGNIYAACTDTTSKMSRLRLHRCNPSQPGITECLGTAVEAHDAAGRSPREDLKVFSICPRGFTVSYGEHLAVGTVAEPQQDSLDLTMCSVVATHE